MLRRRLAFATPFVLIASCKAPAPDSPGKDEQTREDEATVRVYHPDRIDAMIILADAPEPDAAVTVVASSPSSNPPMPMKVRIIDVRVEGDQSVIMIAAGSKKDVDPRRVEVFVAAGDTAHARSDQAEPERRGSLEVIARASIEA